MKLSNTVFPSRAAIALAAVILAGAAAIASFQPIPVDPTPRRPIDAAPVKQARQAKVVALKLHADWCPACKTMGTLFEDLGKKFDAEPVLFVRLDLTEQRGRTQGEYMVSALGLGKLWQELGEGKKTGEIVLVDLGAKKVVQTISADAGWDKAEKLLSESIKK